MLDAMMAAIFVFLGAVAVCFITVAAVGLIRTGSASDGMCAPSRRANITASKPQPQRRVVQPEPAPPPAAVPVVPQGIPVDWPTRVVRPVPLSRR